MISIKIFVDAGEARSGPPLGPVLGQYQIDINIFCKEFNEKTAHVSKGVPLPVIIKRFENKTYKLIIKNPTLNFMLNQLLSGISNKEISLGRLYDLIKLFSVVSKKDIKTTSRIVFGTLRSMKIQIK